MKVTYFAKFLKHKQQETVQNRIPKLKLACQPYDKNILTPLKSKINHYIFG